MSDVDDLVTWLRAQYDDDERVARAAAGRYPNWDTTSDGNVVQLDTGGSGYLAAGPWDGDLFEVGEHMARHDPARVLVEVDAKRRILDLHVPYPTLQHMASGDITVCSTCGSVDDSPVAWPCPTVRLLALPHADRPGYRDEWKP